MQVLQIIIMVLFFLCCAVLIFLILIQSGKGGGLGVLGGGGSGSAFGSSTMDVITRASWWGALAFFVLSIIAAVAFSDVGPELKTGPAENVELTPGAIPENGPRPGAPAAEKPAEPAAPR